MSAKDKNTDSRALLEMSGTDGRNKNEQKS